MLHDRPSEQAAHAILRRLRAGEGIDTTRPDALVAEMEALLDAYEAELAAVVDEVYAAGSGSAAPWAEVERRALARGAPLGEAALPRLEASLAALLLASEHVDEIFLDDDALARVVRAALLDYLPAIAASVLERRPPAATASATATPRLVPAPAPASTPARRTTLADEGFPFPLFEAPRADACLDPAGPCAICKAPAEPRFNGACYACFRAGRARLTMGTELGMVRPEDADAGLTHGLPFYAVPPG